MSERARRAKRSWAWYRLRVSAPRARMIEALNDAKAAVADAGAELDSLDAPAVRTALGPWRGNIPPSPADPPPPSRIGGPYTCQVVRVELERTDGTVDGPEGSWRPTGERYAAISSMTAGNGTPVPVPAALGLTVELAVELVRLVPARTRVRARALSGALGRTLDAVAADPGAPFTAQWGDAHGAKVEHWRIVDPETNETADGQER